MAQPSTPWMRPEAAPHMLEQLRERFTQLTCPDAAGMFRRYHGRLALFRPRKVLEAYWTNHWKDAERRHKLLVERKGKVLAPYEDLLAKYVPRKGLVLEAGCGLGQVVGALRDSGYQVRGVEYDREVVGFVKDKFPELDVVVGDVNALAEPDASVETYVSLGVLEHFPDGMEQALREAHRVLTASGHALIMVPLLNVARARHLRSLDEAAGADRSELAFYQFYFSPDEFTELARAASLEVVDWRGINPSSHLQREHPVASRVWQSRFGRSRLRDPMARAMKQLPEWANRRYAHMGMYVCKRA